MSGSVDALCVYNNKLYAGGQFVYADTLLANYIAGTNDTSWSALGSGMGGGPNPYVYNLTVYNGKLIAAGNFTIAGGVPANLIASWDGSKWDSLGSGLNNGASVYALAVYNGLLYVGGDIITAGGVRVNNIAVWDGNKWSSAGADYANVTALGAYDTVLYAGGGYYLSTYDTKSWLLLTNVEMSGVNMNSCEVNSIIGVDGNVYVGGEFDILSSMGEGFYDIAQWNGHTWNMLGSLNVGSGAVVAMVDTNSILYVGGEFDTAGRMAVDNIAAWNGGSWLKMGTGVTNIVQAMAYYRGNLFVGGGFDTAGGQVVNYIAVWGNPIPLSIPPLKAKDELKIYPNPNMGKFSVELQDVSRNPRIRIYNILGQQIYEALIYSENTSINLNSVSAGIYFVNIVQGEKTYNDKIIINSFY